MSRDVAVQFGPRARYEFRVGDTDLHAVTENDAQRWLDQQWDVLECAPIRPAAKLLLVDKVLGVARNAGEKRFAENDPWALAFVRNVARLLDRPVILVDVADSRVG